MIVNAPLAPASQHIGHQYNVQQYPICANLEPRAPSLVQTTASVHHQQQAVPTRQAFSVLDTDFYNAQLQQQYQYQHQSQSRYNTKFWLENEDASEVVNLVITGGPKWGFRIKQLNDNRVIVSRLDKGPAEKCGLKVNDEILSVNNVPLLNTPRSLLLHDYPDPLQQQQQQSTDQISSQQQQQASEKAGATEKSEGSPLDVQIVPTQHAQPMTFMSPIGPSLELSKIDFAYQLIKHSSITNKLILSVKRFLNPAYARASVAATNSQLLDEQGACQDDFQQQRANEENIAPSSAKRPHTVLGVHHAYKCCECYCDNEGKWVCNVKCLSLFLWSNKLTMDAYNASNDMCVCIIDMWLPATMQYFLNHLCRCRFARLI